MWSCRSLKVPPACLNRAMRALEIGDFKEDVGAALARASSGEVVTLTQEGQPVAELGPVRMSTYQQLRDLGLERPPWRTSTPTRCRPKTSLTGGASSANCRTDEVCHQAPCATM